MYFSISTPKIAVVHPIDEPVLFCLYIEHGKIWSEFSDVIF